MRDMSLEEYLNAIEKAKTTEDLEGIPWSYETHTYHIARTKGINCNFTDPEWIGERSEYDFKNLTVVESTNVKKCDGYTERYVNEMVFPLNTIDHINHEKTSVEGPYKDKLIELTINESESGKDEN